MAKWKSHFKKYNTEEKINALLPDGVIVVGPIPQDCGPETKLIFIDPTYGEFTSSIRGLKDVGVSTHPKLVAKRRAEKMLKERGYSNNFQSDAANERRIKAFRENKEQILSKRKATNLKKYGVEDPMQLPEHRERFSKNNPMKDENIRSKLINKGGTPESIEKGLITKAINRSEKTSNLEKELNSYLTQMGVEHSPGFFGSPNPTQLDCKIPSKRICIEMNGEYWHSEKFRDKYYHLSKTNKAASEGYRMIHLWGSEWEKRNFQCKSFIHSALGLNKVKLDARKCVLKEVEKSEAVEFLKQYHILGAGNFNIAYGLYYNEQLVSMIALGKHHRQTNKDLILTRYIGKYNVSVRGGLSKLCSHTFKHHGVFYTYIDLRMSTGDAWKSCGWTEVSRSGPDYFYYKPGTGIIKKQARQKRVVKTPEGMTELEHAIKDGLYKVWDCGKIKLIYGKD